MNAQPHAQRVPTNWVGIFLALALLATLLQAGSPGFDLTSDGIWTLAKHFPKSTQQKIEKKQKKARGKEKAKKVERTQAIPVNVDIPNLYLGLYQEYAGKDWAIIAGIYKIESDHGQSHAPGVHSGVNSFGCCAGPGQFNLGGTWQTWRSSPQANIYDPRDAVPATVKMLRSFYAMSPSSRFYRGNDCSSTYGLRNRRWVNAIMHYNKACWYVAEVAAWVHTYEKAPTKKPPRSKSKAPNGLSFTTAHGCNPAKDWRKGVLTPEVQGFMLKMARRFQFRVSCGQTGHSQFVKGTARQSAHWTGRAFDVDQVEGQVVSEANPHDEFGRAALDYGARQVGGPHVLCGSPRCFTDEGHKGHWHIQP